GDNALVSILPDTLQALPGVAIGRVLYDMVLSPADTNLVFISDETGSRLYKNDAPLPKALSIHARADFSADGNTLYAVDQETCVLSTYKVASDGLTLLQSFGTVGCSDFKAANGFLFFNSGAIVDTSTGAKLTNS